MKIKFVCHGLIMRHANFHDNWTMASNLLHIKMGGENERGAGKGSKLDQ